MRKKALLLNKFTDSLISVTDYNQNLFSADDTKYKKMIISLKNVIKGELTDKQRVCLVMYYVNGMRMKDIAAELEIGISSVSRHIKKGRNRVQKTMRYYFDDI